MQSAEVDTVMMVKDGETVVIGGLINTRRERVRKQVPILGDIPYLGLLFGVNTWSDINNEIVVLITPHIVGTEFDQFMQDKLDHYDDAAEQLDSARRDAKEILDHPIKGALKRLGN